MCIGIFLHTSFSCAVSNALEFSHPEPSTKEKKSDTNNRFFSPLEKNIEYVSVIWLYDEFSTLFLVMQSLLLTMCCFFFLLQNCGTICYCSIEFVVIKWEKFGIEAFNRCFSPPKIIALTNSIQISLTTHKYYIFFTSAVKLTYYQKKKSLPTIFVCLYKRYKSQCNVSK